MIYIYMYIFDILSIFQHCFIPGCKTSAKTKSMETQTMTEKIKKYTSCIGCEKPFENADPLILPCLHSICPVCLEKPLQENSRVCPLCFETFPPAGSEPFPTDHRRKMVSEFIKNKSEGFCYVLCQQCAENNVRVKCNDCDRLLCADCLKNHDKFTKGHVKIEVDDLKNMTFLDTVVPLQCPVKQKPSKFTPQTILLH